MFPIIYAPNSQEFTSHGVGVLVDCLSCEVTEERNGIFEATLTYPVTGHHADAIVGGAIFKAVAHRGDTGQLFEIYEINTDFEGNIEAQARHISYRLGYIPCSPFSAHNVIDAFSYLPSHMIETGGFTFQTTKQTNADFKIDIPRSTRAVLGGEEGSFLDVYGGEYEFDNFTVKLHGNRGSDKGVVLRYGKNITDISQEQEISETYTGLYPYYNSDDTYIELPEKVIYCSNADSFAYHRVMILDCSNEFKDEYDDPKVPTEAEMRTFAQTYMNDHDFGVPKVSLSVSFDAQGVTDMEYVLLCDTVTVIFPELRVSAKSKVIKTVYDTILGKYKEIELGSPKASFASTLASQISGSAEKSSLELLDTRNHLEKAQDELTAKLLGANGGYKVEVTNADGQIIETLYLDNLDPALANHVWRWNINGLGYSSTGINGPYTIGITSDGEIVADFITTGTLTANLIKAGILSSENGKYWLNMSTGEAKLQSGNIGNWNIDENRLYKSATITAHAFSSVDMARMSDVVLGHLDEATVLAQFPYYDLDGDGHITKFDVELAVDSILGIIPNGVISGSTTQLYPSKVYGAVSSIYDMSQGIGFVSGPFGVWGTALLGKALKLTNTLGGDSSSKQINLTPEYGLVMGFDVTYPQYEVSSVLLTKAAGLILTQGDGRKCVLDPRSGLTFYAADGTTVTKSYPAT